jgi:hypothetical protein
MQTSTRAPIAPASERAAVGLFSKDDAHQVVTNLKNDLAESGTTLDEILSRYASVVHNDERRDRARRTLTDLLNGALNAADLHQIVEVLYFAGYQRLLAKHYLRFPAYNVLEGYFANATSEPWTPLVDPRPEVPGRKWSLFGRDIGFPIGVPASVLTDNARWIRHLADNGFNVLTYRTVRSRAHKASPAPNWAFVPDQKEPFDLEEAQPAVRADPWDWVDPGSRDVTTTNSFGVPSDDPALWMEEIHKALTVLGDDQLLIVSVLGDDYEQSPARLDVVAADFADVAFLAEEAGASIIELNLSCPNSIDPQYGDVKPPLCSNVEMTARVVEAVRERLRGRTRLVAKLSYLEENALASLVHRIVPFVDGIAGINTLQTTVTRVDDTPTFPGRSRAGVSGIAVRDHARDFVARLARLRIESGKYFEIVGMGGVTDPESFQDLYELGASAVQTASGAFANPFLAAECIDELGESLPDAPSIGDPELVTSLRSLLTDAFGKATHVSRAEVAGRLPLRPAQTFSLLDTMAREGELEAIVDSPGFYRVAAHSR